MTKECETQVSLEQTLDEMHGENYDSIAPFTYTFLGACAVAALGAMAAQAAHHFLFDY